MRPSNTLIDPTPLTQLLRLHAGSEMNAFAAWLASLPRLHSLDSLTTGERVAMRERLEANGARLAQQWQAARSAPALSDDQQAAEWLR